MLLLFLVLHCFSSFLLVPKKFEFLLRRQICNLYSRHFFHSLMYLTSLEFICKKYFDDTSNPCCIIMTSQWQTFKGKKIKIFNLSRASLYSLSAPKKKQWGTVDKKHELWHKTDQALNPTSAMYYPQFHHLKTEIISTL